MDDKFYVPFETAQRLKEAGYPQEVDYAGCVYTLPQGGFYPQLDIDLARRRSEGEPIAAPTYYEALDWFESKGLYIDYGIYSCYNNATKEHKMTYIVHVSIYVPQLHGSKVWYQTKTYDTKEEALNEAILAAIDLLNKQQQ